MSTFDDLIRERDIDLTSARAELSELRKDKARLDWIQSHFGESEILGGWLVTFMRDRCFFIDAKSGKGHTTIRRAFDAAMEAEG